MAFRNNFLTRNAKKYDPELTLSRDTNSKDSAFQKKEKFYQDLKKDVSEKVAREKYWKNQYDVYMQHYLEGYKKDTLKEYKEIRKAFPEVHFDMSVRLKSKAGAFEKIVRKLRSRSSWKYL